MAKKSSARRIHLLDELRGLDIILMICFHAFYTMGWVLDWEIGRTLFVFFQPVEPFFAGIFVFICGICCWFSHNNWLRGGVLAAIAAGMSLFLYFFMPDRMIWYGVLHLLATCILLFAILRPLLNRIPAWLGLLLSVTLAVLTWNIPYYNGSTFGVEGIWQVAVPQTILDNPWLHPLGLGHGGLYGTDYFPLMPWFFVFMAGCFVGVWAKNGKFPQWTYRSRVPFLSAVGRHTLIIYVVHQPIIFGVGMAIEQIIRWISG